MQIYIAAPFFKPDQLALVKDIEAIITSISGITYYSPRDDGVLINMSPAERAAASAEIFETNCTKIRMSRLIFAVIDDFDPGTIWEMGYAYAKHMPIFSFSNKGYGANVMLKHSVNAHVNGGLAAAYAILTDFAHHGLRDTYPEQLRTET